MDTLFWALGLLVIGLIVGAIARLFVHTGTKMGCLGTALLGIVGSYVGGTLGAVLFDEEFDLRRTRSWIGAIIGAVIILLVLRLTSGRRNRWKW